MLQKKAAHAQRQKRFELAVTFEKGRVMKPGRPSDSQKKQALLVPEPKGTQQQNNLALQQSRLLTQTVKLFSREGGHNILPSVAAAGGGIVPLYKDKMATPKCQLFSAPLDAAQEPSPAPGWRTLSPAAPQHRYLSGFTANEF